MVDRQPDFSLSIENTSQVAPCHSKVWPCFNGFQVTSLGGEKDASNLAFQPFEFWVNDAAPGFLNHSRQDMGHYFHILGLAQAPSFGVLSKSEGFARVVKTTFDVF